METTFLDAQKIIIRNRLKAILSHLQDVKEKSQEDEIYHRSFVSLISEHNLSNNSLLKRYSNAIKDPEPLASTMTALCYKYPIMMKKSYLKMFPKELLNRDFLDVEEKSTRQPGWIGCKIEMVQRYLDLHHEIDDDQVKVIDVLMSSEREKLKSFQEIDWENSEIMFGTQLETRKLIKMQEPMIQGLKPGQIEPLICKILSPESSCLEDIQRIYDANKDKFPDAIPRSLSITEQASALRNVLDEKARFLPVLQSVIRSDLYQHATALYSSHWQMNLIHKKEREEGEIPESATLNVMAISSSLIHCLKKSPFEHDMKNICKSLYFEKENVYNILSDCDGHTHQDVQYLRALCGLPSQNVIFYDGQFVKLHLYPQEHKKVYDETHFHFVTKNIKGNAHVSNRVRMSLGWLPFNELLEIYGLMTAIMLYKRKIRFMLTKKNLREIVSDVIKEKSLMNNIYKRGEHLIKKSEFNKAMKEKRGNIFNIIITNTSTIDEIVISDNIGEISPKRFNDVFIKYKESVPRFETIGGESIINMSDFIELKKRNICYLSVAEIDDVTPLTEVREKTFLRVVNIEQRVVLMVKHNIRNFEKMKKSIKEDKYSNNYLYFDDLMDKEQGMQLGDTCYTLLKAIEVKNLYDVFPKEVTSFMFIFAKLSYYRDTASQITLKHGYFIDLNFKASLQNSKNLLWTENGVLKTINYSYGSTYDDSEEHFKLLIFQRENPSYKIVLYTDEEDPEIIYTKEEGMKRLDLMEDSEIFGGSVEITYKGRIFTMTKDRDFLININRSMNRVVRAAKRSTVMIDDRLKSISEGPQKRLRLE